jgi:probable rRNA maturation factor
MSRAARTCGQAVTVRRLARGAGVRSRDLIRAVKAAADRPIRSLNIVLAGDQLLSRLHQQFMSDPTPTDVITFDLRDDTSCQTAIEGEVTISVDMAAREARRRGLSVSEELLRYAVHGTLHLCGYDDRTAVQRRRMRRAEDAVLAQFFARRKH